MQKVCTPASTATAVPWLCGGRVGPCICRPASRRAFLRVLTGRVASLVCVPVRNRRLFVRIMRHMGALWLRRARAECRRARGHSASWGGHMAAELLLALCKLLMHQCFVVAWRGACAQYFVWRRCGTICPLVWHAATAAALSWYDAPGRHA